MEKYQNLGQSKPNHEKMDKKLVLDIKRSLCPKISNRISEIFEIIRGVQNSRITMERQIILDIFDELEEIFINFDVSYVFKSAEDVDLFLKFLKNLDIDVKTRAIDCLSAAASHASAFKNIVSKIDVHFLMHLVELHFSSPTVCYALISLLNSIAKSFPAIAQCVMAAILSEDTHIKIFSVNCHRCHLIFCKLIRSIQTASPDLVQPLFDFDFLCILSFSIINDDLAKSCVSIILNLDNRFLFF